MLIPIKKILLEFEGPGFSAAKQKSSLVRSTATHEPLNIYKTPIKSGVKTMADSASTSIAKPKQNIVADNMQAASKESGIAGGK